MQIVKQGREAFIDNDADEYTGAYTSGRREFRPPTTKAADWRATAVLVAGILVALLVCFILYSLWKLIYCWSDLNYTTCRQLAAIEPWIPFTLLVLAIVLISVRILVPVYTKAKQDTAIAQRTLLVLDRFGNQVPADIFSRMTPEAIIAYLADRYQLDVAMETKIAPTKLYRSVNALTTNVTHNNDAQSLLAAGDDGIEGLPIATWLPFVASRPHVILAASTGEGKTVTAKAILAARIQSGSEVFVIDPHSDAWFDLPIRGGGENYIDIQAAIGEVYAEYRSRMQQRDEHLILTQQALPPEHFTALTVLVDEAYLIRGELDHNSKKALNYWELLTKVLGSGARKVNISVVLITQTANVEDIGLSSPLRRNFARIALDTGAIKEMIKQEELDRDRKSLLYQSIIGMQYPATTVMLSQVELLDRTGLLDLANSVKSVRDRLWVPSVCLRDVLASDNGQIADRQTQTDGTDGSLLGTLIELRSKGFTREQARDELGISFDNDLWTLAGNSI